MAPYSDDAKQLLSENLAENKTNLEENNSKSKKKRLEKPKEEVTFRTHLTSLAHISVLLFVYLVVKLALRAEFDFFTWHPLLMAIGWMLLMTEGLYAINKYNTYWRFKTKGSFRVKIHVIILSAGYILSVIGFIVAYINKENKGKSHFVSWHGLFGLLALISTCPPIINGLVLWYRKELGAEHYHRLVKFVHVVTGTLAFFFGALALILSVYSNWYGKKSYRSDSTFYFGLVTVSYPVIWAVYGPSVKLVRVVKNYFSEDKDD
ncbi:transmembrane reductase CYB561D2-like [Euwallacea similis]|uniref:transmembrane reductase CYB561D2-like n=1 Tax=Euwallacea similis TaxID=1736056 RepID=UPI00344E8740